MVKIELHCVGRLKDRYYADACQEYVKRLGSYAQVKIIEHPEAKLPADPSPAEIDRALRSEGAALLASLSDKNTYVIALCVEGAELSSAALAEQIDQVVTQGNSCICFLIGGSNGLHSAVKQRADLCLSMSPMTFPHTLARVMILEQIYRAFSILNGTRYHK